MAGFKSAAKHKRELAKLDKRNAKDQKRAIRKAERASADVKAATQPASVPATHRPAGDSAGKSPAAVSKPLTLSEAVERWKTTKVGHSKTGPRAFSGKRL